MEKHNHHNMTGAASNWGGRKVLVTGADGFIGSHLVEALATRGAQVTALALYNSFDRIGWLDEISEEAAALVRIVRGDVRDPQFVATLCRGHEVVFHLAALIAIPYSYDAPSSYVATNVQGTVNVLRGAQEAGVARIVHTSTSEVYGTARITPITEEHPLQGQSPYSASKIGADMIAESFARSFEVPVATLRPFNAYGPRQSERAVISSVIRQALDERCDAIRVGNLDPERDFTFVSDTVGAFLALAALDPFPAGQVFNAGSGRMVTIGKLVERVRAVSACTKPVISEEKRFRPAASEVMALMADSTRLRSVSGWSPAISLDDGLLATVSWWRERAGTLRARASYMV